MKLRKIDSIEYEKFKDIRCSANQVYPMSIVPDGAYDKNGLGDITTIAYLTTKGFKLVQIPGMWDLQWGQGDSWGSYKYCDGGSANITPPADGYYTINLNTASNVLEIEPYEEDVTVYPEMFIAGLIGFTMSPDYLKKGTANS